MFPSFLGELELEKFALLVFLRWVEMIFSFTDQL